MSRVHSVMGQGSASCPRRKILEVTPDAAVWVKDTVMSPHMERVADVNYAPLLGAFTDDAITQRRECRDEGQP